ARSFARALRRKSSLRAAPERARRRARGNQSSLSLAHRPEGMKARTLIIDDEELARERLRRLFSTHAEIELIGECADGAEAVAAIRKEKPDLVSLDVQMPELDGLAVRGGLEADGMPAIVWLTAH